nr:putative capsid [Marmot picobirnavirus]
MGKKPYYKKQNKNTKGSQSKRSNKNNSKYEDDQATKTKGISPFADYGEQNDPLWYMGQRALVEPAARITTFQQAGRPFTFNSSPSIPTTSYEFNIPMVMAVLWQPTPGISLDATSGISIASSMMYQFIRSKLNYLTSYAPADLGMALMAFDSILIMYHEIVRGFGVINNYDGMNLAWPRAILDACGFDFEDLYTNQAVYRMQFNNLIAKAQSLFMPVETYFNKRHNWLAEHIWTDSNTSKAQLYLYRCTNYYQWDETTSEQGTMCKSIGAPTATATMADWLNMFDGMVEALRSSDSYAKIMADMRKAYDNRDAWVLPFLDENYSIKPEVNDTVLEQLQNSTFWPIKVNNDDITQSVDNNAIICNPTVSILTSSVAASEQANFTRRVIDLMVGDQIINFSHDNPSAEDIVENTRNISTFKRSNDGVAFGDLGTDIMLGCNVFYATTSNTDGSVSWTPHLASYSAIEYVNVDGQAASIWAAFDWAPRLLIINNGTNNSGLSGYMLDFNYWTLIPQTSLQNLNRAINLSVWNVPEDVAPNFDGKYSWK